jgi:hypothetical protein
MDSTRRNVQGAFQRFFSDLLDHTMNDATFSKERLTLSFERWRTQKDELHALEQHLQTQYQEKHAAPRMEEEQRWELYLQNKQAKYQEWVTTKQRQALHEYVQEMYKPSDPNPMADGIYTKYM